MKTILVTGPIGGGKSTVCRFLEAEGYPVYDCDSRTKALYATVPGLKARIEEALGIEWSQIGIIFTDDDRRNRLESIVYPLLVEDIKAWKSGLDSRVAFIESAIAMDKPALDGLYDEVLLVKAGLESRKLRNPAAWQRDSLQSFDESRVTYIIENESTIDNLHSKTAELCKQI